MGLLNWRRSGRSAERPEDAPAPPPQPPPPSDRYVFRAATAADIPDWAKLPPLRPTLPDMPIIVPNFEPSLVSWQPPKRFLEDLGHSISANAPSGLVEGMAVLVPDPPAALAHPLDPGERGVQPEPLPLTLPTPAPRETPPAPDRAWRLPWRRADPTAADPTAAVAAPAAEPLPQPAATPRPEDPAPAPAPGATGDDAPLGAEASLETELPPGPAPDPPAPAEHPGPPAPATATADMADLVGSAPLTSVVQPLAVAPEDTWANRFVSASTPPDMPLPHLTGALLPEGARPQPPEPAEPGWPADYPELAPGPDNPVGEAGAGPSTGPEAAAAPPALPTSGLVGERPTVAEPVAPDRLPPAGTGPAPTTATGGDLPLAAPRPSPPAGDSPRIAPLLSGPAGTADEPSAPMPSPEAPPEPLSLAPPAGAARAPGEDQTGPAPASVVAAEPQPAPDSSGPAPSPSGGDAEPADRDAPMQVAPLLGEAPPLRTESPPGLAAPPGAAGPVSGEQPETVAAAPLVLPQPPSGPRSGLGEPMASLPPTATSLDITTWSTAQQLRASRALMRNQPLRSTRTGPPVEPAVSRPGGGSAPGRGLPVAVQPETADRAAAYPPAVLEPVEPLHPGVAPADLLLAGSGQAPLLSQDPLVTVDPEAGPSRAAPPPEGVRVRTTIGQRHGVDLMAVPVDRSPQGASEAHHVQARGFTSDRAVVIPPEAGSLETGPGAALLAHELTHVAQRARLGGSLPAESTPAAHLLETEALSAELALTTGAAVPRPWPVAETPPLAAGGPAAAVSGPHAATGLPLAGGGANGPDVDSLAASIMDRLSVLGTPAAAPTTQVFTTPWSPAPTASAAPPPAPVQRADPLPAPAPAGPAQAPAGPDGQAGAFTNRPSDQELTNLSRWLYPLIKYRLKGELREDRERAGLLTDHYRRW